MAWLSVVTFAGLPVLSLVKAAPFTFEPGDVLRAWLLIGAAMLGISLLMRVLTRIEGAMCLTGTAVASVAFFHSVTIADRWLAVVLRPVGCEAHRYRLSYLVVLAALLLPALLGRRFPRHREFIVKLLAIWGTATFAVAAWTAAGAALPRLNPASRPELAAWDRLTPEQPFRGDVYLLILDSYPRESILRHRYGVEIATFTDRLRTLGFHILPDSRSPAHLTRHSIPATINGVSDAASIPESIRDLVTSRSRFNDSGLLRLFSRLGHDRYYLPAGSQLPTRLPGATTIEPAFAFTELEWVLLQRTPYNNPRLWKLAGIQGDPLRRRLHHALAALPTLVDRPSPKFVLAHLFAPHYPFWLLADDDATCALPGSWLASDTEAETAFRSALQRQLDRLNDWVLALVARILRATGGNVVILIQGDHGLRFRSAATRHVGPDRAATDDPDGCFGIFNAVYLPEAGAPPRPDLTSAETVRWAIATAFSADFADRVVDAPSPGPEPR